MFILIIITSDVHLNVNSNVIEVSSLFRSNKRKIFRLRRAAVLTTLAIAAACGFWLRKRRRSALSEDCASSERTSTGPWYPPPHYSRCSSFVQALPPPYNEVPEHYLINLINKVLLRPHRDWSMPRSVYRVARRFLYRREKDNLWDNVSTQGGRKKRSQTIVAISIVLTSRHTLFRVTRHLGRVRGTLRSCRSRSWHVHSAHTQLA